MTAWAGKVCHAPTGTKPSEGQSSSPPSKGSLNGRQCNYNGSTDEYCRAIPHRSVLGPHGIAKRQSSAGTSGQDG